MSSNIEPPSSSLLRQAETTASHPTACDTCVLLNLGADLRQPIKRSLVRTRRPAADAAIVVGATTKPHENLKMPHGLLNSRNRTSKCRYFANRSKQRLKTLPQLLGITLALVKFQLSLRAAS
jgi:hypothetical protein